MWRTFGECKKNDIVYTASFDPGTAKLGVCVRSDDLKNNKSEILYVDCVDLKKWGDTWEDGLHEYLSSLFEDEMLANITHVIIEKQNIISFGKRKVFNVNNISVQYFIFSFFMTCFRRLSVKSQIVIIEPKCKTTFHNAPKMNTRPQRKKWAIEKVTEILKKRGDTEGLQMINKKKGSKADMCDAYIQVEAFIASLK